jgi:hypothetical protein
MKTNSAVKKTTNQLSETADSQGTRRVLKTETDSLEQEYVNQVHVDDFLKALRFDPLVSDVILTQSKKSKKKLREQEASKPKGISHTVLQYPLIVSY